MLKRIIALLAALLCLCAVACAEMLVQDESCIINLVDDPEAPFTFKEGAPILEIIFPRVFSSDCIIIRFEGKVMMIDASTKNKKQRGRIRTACESIGVDHIDIAYNSHPHDDHIDGFQAVYKYAPFDKFLITFPADYNGRMKEAIAFMEDKGVPVETVGNGDLIPLSDSGKVKLRVIQHSQKSWTVNDLSAMLMVEYGERRFLLAGDNENRAQKYYAENQAEVDIKADMLKYPHHGQVRLRDDFLKAIDPEFVFINGASNAIGNGLRYLKKHKLPSLVSYMGLTRMRTDGEIWVIDFMHEYNADSERPYTPERP